MSVVRKHVIFPSGKLTISALNLPNLRKILILQKIMKIGVIMNSVNISLPKSDMTFLRKLAKNMGWEITSAQKKKSGIDLGLEDLEKGRVYRAENAEDLLKQILG